MSWDHEVDLLIVGSGAAAMSTALRAADLGTNVLLVEKSDRWGGSTAMSGGVCWIGANPDMTKVGITDDKESALTYLRHITEGEVSDARLEAYATESLRMLAYFNEHTDIRFDPIAKYTDYYAEAPGGRPGGRSMESRPYDGTILGDELKTLRMPHPQSQIMGKFGITAGEAHTLLVNDWRSKVLMLWHFFWYLVRTPGRRKFGRDTRLYTGNALCGRLRKSLLDRKVPIWLETPAESLVVENGRIVGAVVTKDGAPFRIGARQGVMLAAGGFERNLAMRQEHQRAPISTDWSAANLHNTGDGINMGREVGGDVALMKEAWWTPTTLVPKDELAWVLVVEKSLPGSIFVNQHGRRFVNEAAPYIDVVLGMYGELGGEGTDVPCWMVFDARFRHYYPVATVAPGYAMPDSRTPRKLTEGFMHRSESLAALAEAIGVDADALTATVDRFNDHARTGVDEDFGRGTGHGDRYYGDPRVTPNPTLAPLTKAPFYAIAIYPGDLGTKGGLVTDPNGRVLNTEGAAIAGLYSAGNNSASVMGRTYPGAGGTIGPALTFGFLAAEAALADSKMTLPREASITPPAG